MPPATHMPPASRHFLDLDRIGPQALRAIVDRAKALKAGRSGLSKGEPDRPPGLPGRLLIMVFEKASTRTRVSFEVAMRQLGGSAIDLEGSRLQMGRGETVADTARVLSAYGDAILLRTNRHRVLTEMAEYASVPVINALTDRTHPCQLLADVMTVEELKGPIEGQRIAWVGDGNNVATSLIHAAMRFGFKLRLACPDGCTPDPHVLQKAWGEEADVALVDSPQAAVTDAAAVYTDTWSSMGSEREADELEKFIPYRVDSALMKRAGHDALFLHCLPAHRGQEVTDAVLNSSASAVWRQAENRLHAQKAILHWCLAPEALDSQ